MRVYDFIFIHPPRNFEFLTQNIKSRSSYIMMPMGIFGLADLLDREGFSTKIINYPLEKMLNRNYTIIKELKNYSAKVIGVDLHWVLHSAGSLDILKAIKKCFPSCFTLLGGYTATYYAKEIMENYNFIDGIIQGDAEEPIIKLLKNFNNLREVPNLIYRNNGKIIDNQITFVAHELDSLNFAKVKFLDHWKEYINLNYEIMHTPWPVEMARGCVFNCVNCGGCNHSSKLYLKRRNVIFRSPSRVFDDIREIIEVSEIKGIFYGHGVYPNTEKYFMEIHKLIRKEKLDIHADLELWRLPLSKKFIEDFSKTYNLEKSMLWFSVRSFSEAYRKKFTKLYSKFDDSFDFTNEDLKKLIILTKSHNIPLRLFWDAGNPCENSLDLFKSFMYALKLFIKNISKNNKVSMWSEPIIVSPGCLIELYGKKFGVKLRAKNFEDYVKLNRSSKMIVPPIDVSVNFKTNYLTTKNINLANKLMTMLNIVSIITK